VDSVDSVQTSLIAHELMLRMLVSNEMSKNSVFAADARRASMSSWVTWGPIQRMVAICRCLFSVCRLLN